MLVCVVYGNNKQVRKSVQMSRRPSSNQLTIINTNNNKKTLETRPHPCRPYPCLPHSCRPQPFRLPLPLQIIYTNIVMLIKLQRACVATKVLLLYFSINPIQQLFVLKQNSFALVYANYVASLLMYSLSERERECGSIRTSNAGAC